MTYKTILFDFDGTLADTMELMVRTYNERVAPKLNCKIIKRERIPEYKKTPVKELMKAHNISIPKVPIIAFWMRRIIYKEIETAPMYKGMKALIRELFEQGYSLGILTSNSKKNAKKLLRANGLEDCFSFVHSSRRMEGKDKVYAKIADRYGMSPENTIYIGDEVRDIDFTKKVNLPIICVSWGFNDPIILAEKNPEYIVNTPEDILAIINQA